MLTISNSVMPLPENCANLASVCSSADLFTTVKENQIVNSLFKMFRKKIINKAKKKT